MRIYWLIGLLALTAPDQACAWGPEGHSIVAEIAQRKLAREAPDIAQKIAAIMGPGESLASIASWADDFRDEHKSTTNWHFVNIPIASSTFDPETQCKADDPEGDCIIAELDRLKSALRCKSGDEQKQALMFAVHFLGDIHQPLHTVAEEHGGNGIDVLMFMHGARCKTHCRVSAEATNLHAAWDVGLINMTVFDWGAYVTRLENGWLKSQEAQQPGIDGGTPLDWALETHKVAQTVWPLTPANKILDEPYYDRVLPALDRQLGVAGLRLARFLTDAFRATGQCP
jgi:hypothetical protein